MSGPPQPAASTAGIDAPPALVETGLADYRIVRELGAGAMGTVYLAERGGQSFALKVLHPHLLSIKGFFRRFQREAHAGSVVDHENVVRVVDCDFTMTTGRPYYFLVMEYVEGRTLRALQADLGRCPEGLLREIARQVAAGLAAVHAAGIVHRDIKPENILITRDHRVRVMDLGVARVEDTCGRLTGEGQFAGSLLYSSPEQLRGQGLGPPSDLYSLGVVLFELAAGENPFRHADPAAMVHAHLNVVPPYLGDLAPEYSAFFAEVVATLLAKSPADRLESSTRLLDLLVEGERSLWWREREGRQRGGRGPAPAVPVQRPGAFFGRERELHQMHAAWLRARHGEGNVLLLEGEAGIGRSRLVDEFLRSSVGDDAHALYGHYSPSGTDSGLVDALRTKLGPTPSSAAAGRYLPATSDRLAALLGRPAAGSLPLAREAAHAMVTGLLAGMAREAPVVWIVEDLHYSSAESRQALLSLARAARGQPVLLLLTSQPGGLRGELPHLRRLENFDVIHLERLRPSAVTLLLRNVLGSDFVADELAPLIVRKSDGVPLFVFELLRTLSDQELIAELPDGSWVRTREIDEIGVPAAVEDLVRARLAGLSREERDTLDVGAVQGLEFDIDLTASVLGRERVDVLQDLAATERGTHVVRLGGETGRFDHDQILEVVYGDLSPALAAEYHGLLAEAILEALGEADPRDVPGDSAVRLAHHALRGPDPLRARGFMQHAFDYLAASYRSSQAIALVDRALLVEGLLRAEEQIDALLRKAAACDLLGRQSEWRDALDCALAIAESTGDRARRDQARRRLARYLVSVADYEGAEELLSRVLDQEREAGDRRAEASTTGELGSVFHNLGRYGAALLHDRRQLDLAVSIGDRAGEAEGEGRVGDVFHALGLCEEALGCHERHLALAREIRDKQGEARALLGLARLYTTMGDISAANRCAVEAQSIATRIGARRLAAGAVYAAARIEAAAGSGAEAARLFRDVIERFCEVGDYVGVASAAVSSAALVAYDEGAGHALAHLDQAAVLLETVQDPNEMVREAAYRLLVCGGDAAAARATIERREKNVTHETRMETQYALWRATGDPALIDDAHRLLHALRDNAPRAHRKSLMTRVRLHRRIVAGAAAAGG